MKNTKQTESEKKEGISGLSFYCHGDYDYDTATDCDGGCVDDYCRCSYFINKTVSAVDSIDVSIQSLKKDAAGRFRKQSKPPEGIDAYCANRLIYKFALSKPGSFELKTSPGYYGEEIDGIGMDCFVERDLRDMLMTVFQMETDLEKVLFTLEKEYARPLLLTADSDWSAVVREVGLFEEIWMNEDYMQRLKNNEGFSYESLLEKEEIQGVLLEAFPGKYKLIDGYHRFAAAKSLGRTKGKFIVVTYHE